MTGSLSVVLPRSCQRLFVKQARRAQLLLCDGSSSARERRMGPRENLRREGSSTRLLPVIFACMLRWISFASMCPSDCWDRFCLYVLHCADQLSQRFLRVAVKHAR